MGMVLKPPFLKCLVGHGVSAFSSICSIPFLLTRVGRVKGCDLTCVTRESLEPGAWAISLKKKEHTIISELVMIPFSNKKKAGRWRITNLLNTDYKNRAADKGNAFKPLNIFT